MKRISVLIMLAGLALFLTGCTISAAPFDPETEGTVDVIVRKGDAVQHYAVSGDGRVQETAAFAGDEITVYEVDELCFGAYFAVGNDGRIEVVNRLEDVRIYDADGAPAPRTEALMDVLVAASHLEHELWEVRILRTGEADFLWVKLNVTGSVPCTLYWYDPARQGLVELCGFSGKETIGLRVRNLSPLAARPVYAPESPGREADPLMSWCGGRFRLTLAEDGVNLLDGDAVLAWRVTGFTWVGSGLVAVQSAQGCHVLNTATAEVTTFASPEDMPQEWAAEIAEGETNRLHRFRHAYAGADCTAALAALRQDFADNRALCSEAAATILGHPDWLAGRNRIVARGVQRAAPQYNGWSTAEPNSVDWPQVRSLFAAMNPRYVAAENGAVYLHFVLVAEDGHAVPARLYYAPEAATAQMCRAGWTLWESLGDGWYLAALTE